MKIAALVVIIAALVAPAIAESNDDDLVDMQIYGGNVVPKGKALYTSGIRTTATGFNECGGSLITDRHVLTAAHCYADGDTPYVSIGSHYRTGDIDGLRVPIAKQTIHPNNSDYSFDIMVIELAKPVDTTKYRPVRLAQASGKDIRVGEMATVMGWGTTMHTMSSDELLQVDVPVQSIESCRKALNKSGSSSGYNIPNPPVDDSMMCAGGEQYKDACNGDSGGPLVVKHPDAEGGDVLVGVVSWGDGCGKKGYPAVYVSVPATAAWIESVAPGVKFSS